MNPGRGGRDASKNLHRGLCIVGAAGAFTGMLLENHAIFLVGIGVGILGYLGVRGDVKRDRP